MRLAFAVWGLAPAAFWAMSPRELAAALSAGSSPLGFDRAALDRLMTRFPDASASFRGDPAHGLDR
ncbi:MAG: phage tail assembly chaperone [Hyphomicrobiales bacterium]|nr:phage tail assembly chaperone [Hyphomicrobiales bacterium]